MILLEGKLLPDEELDRVMDRLWDVCVETIENREDIAERVILACGRIAEKIKSGAYDDMIKPLLAKGTFTSTQLEEAVSFFEEENLRIKYHTELGILKESIEVQNNEMAESDGEKGLRYRSLEPLGVLFHIAAGNAEGLPFFSVLEGMLAGNVNILKLPSADDGLSVLLLQQIVREEPVLAPYVCVLDVPSTNLKVMKQLGDMADAIVVWGGDEAVSAVRAMASPATQIISWGHKLSFAYVTPESFQDERGQKELYTLARHICATNQLLCSSCQGIFVDTDKEEAVLAAGKQFVRMLEEVRGEFPADVIGIRGKVSLSLYNEELEAMTTGRRVLRGKGVSVIVSADSNLELSYLFKNCWVKPLPRAQIVKALKGKKGYLQTVGLICAKEERGELSERLVKAGVTRVAFGGNMSVMTADAAHDGEYPLRRYCRIVERDVKNH